MNARNAVLMIVAISAISAMVVSGSRAQGSTYPTRVAPVIARTGPIMIGGLHWLDNDSILFHSTPRHDSSKQNATALVAWNIRDDSVREIGEWHSRLGFCYANGFLRFATRKDSSDVILKEGPVDRLTERRLPEREVGIDAVRERGEIPTPFTCNYPKLSDLGPRAKCLLPLREGDGYLDFTGGSCKNTVRQRIEEVAKLGTDAMGQARQQLDEELRASAVVYLPTLQGPEIPLAMRAGEVGAQQIHYSAWSDTYVIAADNTVTRVPGGEWPKSHPHPIYLLSRDGTIKRVDMPYTDWNKGRMAAAVLTRVGIFVVSHQVGKNNAIGDAGIYRIADGRLEPVLRAYVLSIAVSPDGCNVATTANKFNSGGPKLLVISVCRGGQ